MQNLRSSFNCNVQTLLDLYTFGDPFSEYLSILSLKTGTETDLQIQFFVKHYHIYGNGLNILGDLIALIEPSISQQFL